MNLETPPVTNSTPGNAAYIIASFRKFAPEPQSTPENLYPAADHPRNSTDNTLNALTPIQQGIIVTTLSGGPLIAGEANALNISTGDPNVALDGAMLYAKTTAQARVGSFTDPSGTFKDFPGCGKNSQGQHAGVIHQQSITDCVSSPILVP